MNSIINWGFGFLLSDYGGFSKSLISSVISML